MLLRMPVTQTPAAKTVRSGQGPGGTRGKMTEALAILSARRSFFLALTSELLPREPSLSCQLAAHNSLSSVCCVLVHPCLRESPRHLLNGQALTREGWAGTEKRNIAPGDQLRLAPVVRDSHTGRAAPTIPDPAIFA
jgi:hypothetical protein